MEQVQVALFAFHILLLLSRSSFSCKEYERKALLALKQSFTDTSDRLVSWAGENCCEWEGVGCDNTTGNVVALDLRCSELAAFKIDPALAKLKHLKYLDLSGNNFNALQIPKFIGSMKQLQYLNLSQANFAGQVPRQLGNLTDLRTLDLYSSGDFPMEADKLQWTFGLQRLRYLDMSGVNLSQALDSMEVLHKLPSLLYFRLSSCQLENVHLTKFLANSTSILQHLDLSDNNFSIPVPLALANLSSIRVLDLSFNFLSSSIPSWLQTKVSLRNLNLAGNSFTRVEGGVLGLLSESCALKSLDLSFNLLEDDITNSRANLSRCKRYDLESVFMNFNSLRGHLSNRLENFTHLRHLELGSNSFSGDIPASLGILPFLQYLDLSHNHFNGNIPRSLGNLSSLERLDFSNNDLSGVVREVNFAKLSRLLYLDLSSNPLSLETSSDWLPPFQLQTLILRSLKMNTSFPQWLQTQNKMLLLDVSNAGILGSLPDNIGDPFPCLNSLRMANNRISGLVPQSLCKLRDLELLDLGNNQFTGMIPDCWNDSQALQVIDLSSNQLSGPLPASLSRVASLQSLSLNNNPLKVEIPFSSCNWTTLVILDMGDNNLFGKIPPWSGECLPMLQALRLRANELSGAFPPELCSLQKLQIVDLANNRLSGTIPKCFGNFSVMASLQVTGIGPVNVGPFPSEGSLTEVTKGEEQDYTANLGLFVNMDLSCNKLAGAIPWELTNLQSLLGLNLSFNHLSGPIPEMIGRMKSLESLDLSNNHLIGTIPKSLSSINTLEHLNLSCNNLHGMIPTGNQLQTLNDPSIYTGNPGLCGDPLPNKCGGGKSANTQTSSATNHDAGSKQDDKWFFISMPLGFVTGFWGVVGILFLNKRWRTVYFKLADDFADWILNHLRLIGM